MQVRPRFVQQSASPVHVWPYWPQVVPPPPVLPSVPPPVLPPSGVAAAPQVPLLEPVGTTHGSPLQQSAVVVHAPPVAMHCVAPHTKGGEPDGFGTHGLLQQSALDAQAVPG